MFCQKHIPEYYEDLGRYCEWYHYRHVGSLVYYFIDRQYFIDNVAPKSNKILKIRSNYDFLLTDDPLDSIFAFANKPEVVIASFNYVLRTEAQTSYLKIANNRGFLDLVTDLGFLIYSEQHRLTVSKEFYFLFRSFGIKNDRLHYSHLVRTHSDYLNKKEFLKYTNLEQFRNELFLLDEDFQ
jgi:hypothetical protein